MHKDGTILLALSGWDPDFWIAELNHHAPKRPVVTRPTAETAAEIEYAVVWKQQPGILADLPNLKAIFSLGAGVDHVFQDTQLPDVPIVRVVSPDLTNRMSEYVVWQALDHLRRGQLYRSQQSERIWAEDRHQPAASAVTVGLMGLGQLGLDAANKLRAIGFQVAGWSRSKKEAEGISLFYGQDGLGRFLSVSDILVVLLPLTPETKGILNTDLFHKLKKEGVLGAPCLINAGRGGLQKEDDIVAALNAGLLSSARLDVFNTEPLPAEHPLWSHPDVFITPHAAAASVPKQLVEPIVRQMAAYDRGERLVNLVDRHQQY